MRPVLRGLAAPALALLALTTACSAGSTPGAATAGASSGAAQVRRLTLTVVGDRVTGDTGTVPVKLGEPVELTVTSDVADEVHVHGVDIGKDVPAGGTVVIDFTQRAPGRFEVELESRKRVLTRLQVS